MFAQLLYMLRSLKVPERCVKCIKTDALVLQNVATKTQASLAGIAERTFEDLPRLRSLYDNVAANQRQLNSYCSVSERKDDRALVYRITSGDAVRPLNGVYRTPRWNATTPVAAEQWQDVARTDAFALMR